MRVYNVRLRKDIGFGNTLQILSEIFHSMVKHAFDFNKNRFQRERER